MRALSRVPGWAAALQREPEPMKGCRPAGQADMCTSATLGPRSCLRSCSHLGQPPLLGLQFDLHQGALHLGALLRLPLRRQRLVDLSGGQGKRTSRQGWLVGHGVHARSRGRDWLHCVAAFALLGSQCRAALERCPAGAEAVPAHLVQPLLQLLGLLKSCPCGSLPLRLCRLCCIWALRQGMRSRVRGPG